MERSEVRTVTPKAKRSLFASNERTAFSPIAIRRGITTETQSGEAFDRAHAEVRNQMLVLVLVVVLVLE
jgi:hypothetical protein